MAASSFAGRALLVTEAGNGIGKATALQLATLGATVAVGDLPAATAAAQRAYQPAGDLPIETGTI